MMNGAGVTKLYTRNNKIKDINKQVAQPNHVKSKKDHVNDAHQCKISIHQSIKSLSNHAKLAQNTKYRLQDQLKVQSISTKQNLSKEQRMRCLLGDLTPLKKPIQNRQRVMLNDHLPFTKQKTSSHLAHMSQNLQKIGLIAKASKIKIQLKRYQMKQRLRLLRVER